MANASELLVGVPCPTSGTLSTRGFSTQAIDRSGGVLTNAACSSSASLASYDSSSGGSVLYLSNSMGYVAWLGQSNTQGVEVAEGWDEDHTKDVVTSEENVAPLQGGNHVDINPFPTPDPAPRDPLPQRDATRYHKAYSFTRRQPVRVRIFRDR